ncbi:MAG: sigma-70 family RNA polymerase sigma factor [Planctomycetota bacterium]
MNPSSQEDPALLDRLAAGDRDALAALFALHRDRLRRMVEFRLHPRLLRRIDPDDVLQDAWLDAVQRIDSYSNQRDRSAYLWLRLVLGQTIIDLHRRHLGAQMRDAKQEVPLVRYAGPAMSSDAISMHLTGGLTSPSGVAERNEAAIRLREALDSLDEIDREILVLRHLEELTNAEVCEILELKPTAASNRYVRALARLKGLLVAKSDPEASKD